MTNPPATPFASKSLLEHIARGIIGITAIAQILKRVIECAGGLCPRRWHLVVLRSWLSEAAPCAGPSA